MDQMAGSHGHQKPSGPYVCNKCRKSFQLYSMYACYHGHYLCRSCYQKIIADSQFTFDPNADNSEGNVGKSSNYLLDTGAIHQQGTYDQEMDEPVKGERSMFPNPSAYQQNTLDRHNSLISLATIYKPSLLNLSACSKKPVVCPQYDCRKTIAVSSLHGHFHHEHKQVATIVTQLETRNCLEFDFNDLRSRNRNMCLVLINLESRGDSACMCEEENAFAQRFATARKSRLGQDHTKPFFILVAAKMPCGYRDDNPNTMPRTKEYKPHERVFFYVTSNIIGNYSYTIAVSTPRQNVRIKYFGPLLSLNDDFRKLCEDGKGLVLNHYHINGMSNDGCNSVNLDLILHERDDPLSDCN